MLIPGDLNCNVLGSDPDGSALSKFNSTFGLTQLVKTATRVTEKFKSLIDVALTTNENIIYACDVIQSAISDHSLVSLTLKFKTLRPRNTFVTTRSYKYYDRNCFINDLANVPFHIVDLFDDPDDEVHGFNCLFLQVLDEHAPIRRIRINSRPNPFITPEIKGLMNTRDVWHKKARKTNDKLNWNAYRFFLQEVKCEIKLAEKEPVRSEILKSNGNSNSIWKILNLCLPKKNVPLAAVENPFLLANKFNEFYANVGKVTALRAPNLAEEHNINIRGTGGIHHCESVRSSGQNSTTLFTFQSITTGDVQRIITSLPSNKAPGCNKLNARILKDSSPVIAPIISNVINNSFSLCCFPLSWKKAEVVPVLKSGDSEEPANTRPISLLPILSKVCERAAHSQFVNFLDSSNIIHQMQSGNRKFHLTESALLHFTDELLNNMDQRKMSVIFLLDMSKAFDSIRHDLMLSKLRKTGVSESACAWFESYLSQREQVVKIQETLSSPLPVTVGVPQGSILGPVLFTL